MLREGKLTPFQSPDGSLPKEEAVYAGYNEAGALVGFAVPAEGPGFQDTIKLLYGYNAEKKRVVGMEVLESRETPGLGDKIITDDDFLANFAALAVDPSIEPVKADKSAANQVDCITGATISSESVVSILEKSVQRWKPMLADLAATKEVSGNGHAD